MPMTKVLLTKKFYSKDLEYIKSGLDAGIQLIDPQDYTEETLIKNNKEVKVLLGAFVSERLLNESKDLELIQIPWTGVDKLDYNTLSKFNVDVCNSHSNGNVVAEMSVALFLSAVKGIVYHDNQLRKGFWNRPTPNNSNSFSPFSREISKMTIGILGYGSIGKAIHRMLGGLCSNFSVLTHSGIGSDESVNYYEYANEQEFYENIDCLFVCLPLTSKTIGYVDSQRLGWMKKGSFLVNTARGSVINEKDLYEALKKNHLDGAAIDTWWQGPSAKEEFHPSEFPFKDLDQIVMSPHRSGMIQGSLPHLDDVITNLNNLHRGLPLINKVDIKEKY